MSKTGIKKQLGKVEIIPGVSFLAKLFANPYKSILFVCTALYAQILTFGLVHFDDHGFVLMASDTLKLSNIPQFFKHSVFWVLGDTTQDTDVFYRPLQNVMYAVCNTIAPNQAWIYHFSGMTLHAVTSCVLYRFFVELKYHSSIAFVFALLYCVHPVLVQGVAWIAGIGDQMAALFCLFAAIYFFEFINERGNQKNLFLHLIFLACALFSKEISIMLVPVFLFWYFVINKTANQRALVIALFAWAGIIVIYFIFRSNAVYTAKNNLLVSAFASLKVNGPLLFEYFEKIFLPYRLSPIPSREDAQLWMGGIILLVLIFLFIFRKRVTRMSLFGATWFMVFLFPAFIQQNPQSHFFVFEHRLYLPLIGIIICMMELVNISRVNINSGFQKYGFAAVLLVFFAITFSYSRTFTDRYTFYDRAISSSPQSVLAYNGFGKLLLEDKKQEEAIKAFKKSFEYKSDDIQTTGKIAEIYLKNLNNPREAILWFKKTLDINPKSVEAAVSIGDAYFNYLRDTSNAVLWYENAIKINPHNEFALANLGVIYAGQSKNSEARKYLSKALKSNPQNLAALKWMAISYFNEGKVAEAVSWLNRGYEQYPGDADILRNLMICYYKLNDFNNTRKFASFCTSYQIPDEIKIYIEK